MFFSRRCISRSYPTLRQFLDMVLEGYVIDTSQLCVDLCYTFPSSSKNWISSGLRAFSPFLSPWKALSVSNFTPNQWWEFLARLPGENGRVKWVGGIKICLPAKWEQRVLPSEQRDEHVRQQTTTWHEVNPTHCLKTGGLVSPELLIKGKLWCNSSACSIDQILLA